MSLPSPFINSAQDYASGGGIHSVSVAAPYGISDVRGEKDFIACIITAKEQVRGEGAYIDTSNVSWTDLSTIGAYSGGLGKSQWIHDPGSGPRTFIWIGYRTVDFGSEPSTYTFSLHSSGSGASHYAAGIASYRDVTFSAEVDSFEAVLGPGPVPIEAVGAFTGKQVEIAAGDFGYGGSAAIEVSYKDIQAEILLFSSIDVSGLISSTDFSTDLSVLSPDGIATYIGDFVRADSGVCGLFDGEVYVDENGVYVGDFHIGDGPGGPYGWVHCGATCENPYFFFGIFRSWAVEPCLCAGTDADDVRAGVPFTFGTYRAYTTADESGPPGLEDVPAMTVDLAGTGVGVVIWAGSQVFDTATNEWAGHGSVFTGDTGWNMSPDVPDWITQCWARVVPDANGYVLEDCSLDFALAPNGFSNIGIDAPLLLTEDWQFYQQHVFYSDWLSEPFYWPMWQFSGSDLENVVPFRVYFFSEPIDLTGWAPKGRVEIKCPHLYPATAPTPTGPTPLWLANYHGHGNLPDV